MYQRNCAIMVIRLKVVCFVEVIKEITDIVDGPISGEVKATTVDAEGMIAEGREIAKIQQWQYQRLPEHSLLHGSDF